MHYEKWENIIIDWVNCLKLSGRVNKIEDLKNGFFFINFLTYVTSDAVYNTHNILQLVSKFLKDQYPNILLHNDYDLQGLEHDDTVIICSLFLHFSCICDGRTCFTFPLCHQLSRETQICIRTYLENVTVESTLDRIYNAIQCAVNRYLKPRDIYTNSTPDMGVGCSPLQELLSISSSQLASLENLDEVLIALEVDIQLQEDAVTDKSVDENEMELKYDECEIKKNVVQWKEAFDYNFYHNRTNTLQQSLRSHVGELEECFQNLEIELVQLQKEKSVLQKRVEKIEMLKYGDDGLIGNKKEECVLNKLRMTFIELEALIETVKETKNQVNPLSLILNVAESNQEDLNEILQCNIENAHNLKKNIELFYVSYSKLEENYVNLKKYNDNYVKQISTFCDGQKDLDCVRMELGASATQVLDFLKESNASLLVNELEQQINSSTNRIEELLSDFNDLVNEPSEVEYEISECKCLDEEILAMETQYNLLLSNYNEKDFYLTSITTNFNLVENKLDTEIQTLRKFSNLHDFNYLNDSKPNEDTYKDTVVTFQELVADLKLNVTIYSDKTFLNLSEYQILNGHLNYALLQVPVLEELILEQVRNIKILEYNILEVTETINDLQMLEDTVSLQNNEGSLNLKLFKYLHKLENDKMLLDNLHKSIDSLEEIKTDIDGKVTSLENALVENAGYESEIMELQALGSVFEEEIFKKMEESVRYTETVDDLQENVDILRMQLFQMKNTDQCETRRISNTVAKYFKEDIKTINAEIKYYQTSIHEFELELLGLKTGLSEAEQDLVMITDTTEEFEDVVNFTKSSFDKRVLILDTAAKEIERKLAVLNEEEIEMTRDLEEKWRIYNDLKKENECYVCELKKVEREIDEMVKEVNMQGGRGEINLCLTANPGLLGRKLKIDEKKNELHKLEIKVTELNNTILGLEDELSAAQKQDDAVIEESKMFHIKILILTNLRHILEEDYNFEIEENLTKLGSHLSREKEQLHEIIREYKKQQQDIETKVAYFKSALFENFNESQSMIRSYNIMGNCNMYQIFEIHDRLFELNKQNVSTKRECQMYVKSLCASTDKLHVEIATYVKSLENNYKNNIGHGEQLTMMKQNLCRVMQRNLTLDKEHEETINKLEIIQNLVESLECQKLQFETELLKQNFYFEEEYEKNITHLNLKVKELIQKEYEMKMKLAKNMNELQQSNWSNNSLYNEFNVMCTEFANLKDDKAYVGKTLENFNYSCQEINEDFNSFSNGHLNTLKENCQKLAQLQNDLSKHIEMLMSENMNLKTSITDLQNYVVVLQAQLDSLAKTRLDNLEKLENEKMKLTNKIKENEENIYALLKDKELLEQNLSVEEKCEEDDDFFVIALLTAKDIFETGKFILEKDIGDNLRKIEEIEQQMVQEESVYQEKIDNKENNIKDILTKIKLLQVELGENSSKNNKLLLELCTVNASLRSFSKRHITLEQALSKQTEKLEIEPVDKEAFVQNIQTQNHALSRNILSAKEEIELLKEKLKSYFIERQALDLESHVVKEKITYHQHHLEKDEKILFDANARTFEKLDYIINSQKCISSLQSKFKVLLFTLTQIKRERRIAIKNRMDICKDSEANIMNIHKNTVEIQENLLKHIIHLDKDYILREKLKKEIEKLMEGEKVAKEILEIQMLEFCNERYTLSQVHCSLNHYINCIMFIFKEIPINFSSNNDVTLLNIADQRALNKKFEDIEQTLVCGLTTEGMRNNTENLTDGYYVLNSIKVERCETLHLFLNLQKAHLICTEKYNLLLESTKGAKKLKEDAFKVGQHIVSLEKEAITLYNSYKKFDGHHIAYSVILTKLNLERNYLENIIYFIKDELEFLQLDLSKNKNAKLLKQLQSFQTLFYDIYYEFMEISRKLYEIILTIIDMSCGLNEDVVNTDFMEEVGSENAFEEIEQCNKSAKGLLKQLLVFKSNCNLKQVYPTQILDINNNKITRAQYSKNFKQNLEQSEVMKQNFTSRIKKCHQKYSLLRNKLYHYYSLNSKNDRRNFSVEFNERNATQLFFGSGKRVNTDQGTEEMLIIKKAKLEACTVDLEQIKRDSFFLAKNSVVGMKSNSFTCQTTREHKSVGTSITFTTNFGQQYPNNDVFTLCTTTPNDMKPVYGFTKTQKKRDLNKLNKSKGDKSTIACKAHDVVDYTFSSYAFEEPQKNNFLNYHLHNNHQNQVVHPKCCIALKKNTTEYMSLDHNNIKMMLFIVVFMFMIFVNERIAA